MNFKYGYVYIITNKLNNKQYVGQKKSAIFVESYWGSGKYIKNAIAKHGIENFERKILGWYDDQKDLDAGEIDGILKYNTLYPNGYNQTLNVFQSGFRQKHSEESKRKMSLTKSLKSIEEKKQSYEKFKNTISKRTDEEKQKLSKKISDGVKQSCFYEKIHSDEYRNKQREITKKRFENSEERLMLSEKSKENWKKIEYRSKCIKNLHLDNSNVQSARAVVNNLVNKNENSLIKYNKSEIAKEKSKKCAERMRNILKNMSDEEKKICKMKMKLGFLKSKFGENSKEYENQINEILKLDPKYDRFDSPRDRWLNKQNSSIKLESKKIIKLNRKIPVYDLTVDGPIHNFQLNSQVYVHNCPGAGKSKIMSYLTKKALEDGKRVVFITLELNEQETMTNILISTVGMTMSELRDPVNREKMIDKITTFRNTYCSDLVVKFYKPSTITTNVIHNYIQKVIQRKKDEEGIDWKPDVIFLDYMDKLLPVDKIKGNIYEDNGGVADDCKNLAIDFECPVITGSQLGRASWNLKGDEVISMASIAESARKAHLAHSLTTINANPQEKELGKSRLYIAKSRGGTPGKVIYLEHNLGRNNFYEIEPWTQEQIAGAVSFSVKDTTSGGSK